MGTVIMQTIMVILLDISGISFRASLNTLLNNFSVFELLHEMESASIGTASFLASDIPKEIFCFKYLSLTSDIPPITMPPRALSAQLSKYSNTIEPPVEYPHMIAFLIFK